MKIKQIVWLLALASLLVASPCLGIDITLTWTASPTPSVVGYIVHMTNTPGPEYENSIDVENVTTHTLVGLDGDLDWCFVVTAYDDLGRPSDYSNEACSFKPEPAMGCAISSVTR